MGCKQKQRGIALDVEFFRGSGQIARVICISNKNPALKKLKAIAHAEHGRVADGQQNNGWFLQSRCSLLRPSNRRVGSCITALSFGIAIALEPYGFIFGGFEPLENRGLKGAAGDAAPGVGVRSTLFVLGDVFRNGFRRGEKRFAFLQQHSVTIMNTSRVCF